MRVPNILIMKNVSILFNIAKITKFFNFKLKFCFRNNYFVTFRKSHIFNPLEIFFYTFYTFYTHPLDKPKGVVSVLRY